MVPNPFELDKPGDLPSLDQYGRLLFTELARSVIRVHPLEKQATSLRWSSIVHRPVTLSEQIEPILSRECLQLSVAVQTRKLGDGIPE